MNTPLQTPQRKQETESIEFTRLKNDINGFSFTSNYVNIYESLIIL